MVLETSFRSKADGVANLGKADPDGTHVEGASAAETRELQRRRY